MRGLIVGLVLALTAGAASAVDSPNDCAKIDEDAQRLACYDRIYRTTATPTTGRGIWWVRSETSKIDDSTNVFVFVKALKQVEGRFGESDFPTLSIVCRENTTDIYIDFAGNFMSDTGGYGEVTTRLDKDKAQVKTWGESTDNSALGLWGGGRAIPYAKSMFGHDVLLVQATPFNENALTIEFPVTGLEEAIKPLREACSW